MICAAIALADVGGRGAAMVGTDPLLPAGRPRPGGGGQSPAFPPG